MRAFERFNRGKHHWRQVRPFNFLLVAHSGALDRGELTSRFLLVARYERDPRKWTRLRWVNVYDPSRSYRTLDSWLLSLRPDWCRGAVGPGPRR